MSERPGLSPEVPEFLTLVRAFLAIDSQVEAREFVEIHPELRDISVVTALVNASHRTTDADGSRASLPNRQARLLCGSADPQVAELVAQLAGMASALKEGPPRDLELVSNMVTLVRSADTLRTVGVAHHRIISQLFNSLAIALANLARYANDPSQHLRIAVELAQGAVDATPEGATLRPRYLSNLANCYGALYKATGNREHLHTAIDHAQTAVDTTLKRATVRPSYLNNLANHYADMWFS